MLKSDLMLNPTHSRPRRDPKGLRFGVLLAMTLAVILVAFAIAMGQQQTDEPPPIDGARRAAVVDTLAKALRESYVFADAGQNMAEAVRKQLRKKEYAALSDPQAFAEALTRDIVAITNDRHLRVGFNPEQITTIRGRHGDTANAARVHDEELASARARNFGFRKVERLSGNIGYLAFDGFSGYAEATETAAAALTFLRDVDALIFDMRRNGGGSPKMIQYISSYLFDGDARHLNTFYLRKNDSLEHFFTYPHILGGRWLRSRCMC